MQNVFKATDYRLHLPDGTTATHSVNIRAAFVAPPGYVLLALDYKQIELRMMAHLSGDAGLVAMLCDSSKDPFRCLAAGWLGCGEDQVRTWACLGCPGVGCSVMLMCSSGLVTCNVILVSVSYLVSFILCVTSSQQ